MKQYILVWGEGYETNPDGSCKTETVGLDYFNSDWDSNDFTKIADLMVGEAVTLSEGGPTLTLMSAVRIR